MSKTSKQHKSAETATGTTRPCRSVLMRHAGKHAVARRKASRLGILTLTLAILVPVIFTAGVSGAGASSLLGLLTTTTTTRPTTTTTSTTIPPSTQTTTAGAPNTPTSASAVASTTSDSTLVSWVAASGPAAVTFTVQVFINTTDVSQGSCTLCSSLAVPGLTPGTWYHFLVFATNTAGNSGVVWTNYVVAQSGCASGVSYCILADATTTGATISHIGSGLLNSLSPTMPSTLAPLHIQNWRLGVGPDSNNPNDWYWGNYDAAVAAGAQVTMVISDAWYEATNNGCGTPSTTCGAETPWSNLAWYQSWVQQFVQAVESTGRHPAYWDVQNEPDAEHVPGDYFDTQNAETATVPNLLSQFGAAYAGIRAADPSAKIDAPSVSYYLATPYETSLDMQTFLNYSVANNLDWNVIAWHENGTTHNWAVWPSEEIQSDVTQTEAEIAARPSLGNPAIALTEYGYQPSLNLPGEIAGELAAIEPSGLTYAVRSCSYSAADSSVANGCVDSPITLDGLLLSNGSTTGVYWVYDTYAAMTGKLISSTPSDYTFSSVGTITSAGDVTLLIGRHQSCTYSNNANCTQSASATPAAANVPVTVGLPWTGLANIAVQEIPDSIGAVSGPTSVSSSTVDVSGGKVSVTIPSFSDGAAYIVTVKPTV